MILAGTSAWVEYLRATGSPVHLYRRCRAGGETVRKLSDCLIAAVALRHGADFEVIARHTPLRVAS